MAQTTTAPTTLHEYKDFVRAEALRIQKDMSWPDDKLNAALRALGLPEKQSLVVGLRVTGTNLLFLDMAEEGATTPEEAQQAALALSMDEVNRRMASLGVTGQYHPESVELHMPPARPKVGDPDWTMTNPSLYATMRGRRMCEEYPTRGQHYCTMPHGHDGPHARGDGSTITHVFTTTR
jgi:hypothetical protein